MDTKPYWRVLRNVSLDKLEETLNQLSGDGYSLYRLDEKTRPDDDDEIYAVTYFNIIACVPGCVART